MGVLLLLWLSQGVIDLDVIRGEDCHISIVQVADLTGVLDNGCYIRCQHLETVPKAENQGRILSNRHQTVGLVGADNTQGIGSLNAVEHLKYSIQKVSRIIILQQLCDHLSVCFGGKGDALGLQKAL